ADLLSRGYAQHDGRTAAAVSFRSVQSRSRAAERRAGSLLDREHVPRFAQRGFSSRPAIMPHRFWCAGDAQRGRGPQRISRARPAGSSCTCPAKQWKQLMSDDTTRLFFGLVGVLMTASIVAGV